MNGNGDWTQLLTLGAVVLGGAITMATTWLANLQQNTIQARERREDRLMPVYLSLQTAIRDVVRLLEDYALTGFTEKDFIDTEAKIKVAFEALKQVTYQIDFMSGPRIIFHTELLEDSIIRLIRSLGFHFRLAPTMTIAETRNKEHVRSELRAISERRMQLLELMRDDLALKAHHRRSLLSIFALLTSPRGKPNNREASMYEPPRRDQDGFLIDDGRYQ